MPEKRTYIRVTLSDGQFLDVYLDADGLTIEQEKKQAAAAIMSVYLVLNPPPVTRPEGVALN